MKNSFEKFTSMQISYNLENLWFYNKSNIIRAPIEAAITAYLIEVMIIFSNKFKIEDLTFNDAFLVIALPVGIAGLTYILYSIGTMWGVFGTLNKILEELRKHDNMAKLDYCEEKFKKLMLRVHVTGFLCYLVMSVIVGKLLTQVLEVDVIWTIILWGSLFGLLWNAQGYINDLRIDWRKIVRITGDEISLSEKAKYEKYKAFMGSVIFLGIIFLVVISVMISILLKLDIGTINDVIFNVLPKTLILPIFLTLVMLYIRKTYNLFFNDEVNKGIFINITKL